MAKPGVVNIANHYKGDTFDGIQYTILNSSDNLPIDLTGATIKSQFRKSNRKGSIILEITDGVGITVSDAVNGIFEIDSFLLDWQPSTYYYDIEITFSNGVVKTYIEGTLIVNQDITNG